MRTRGWTVTLAVLAIAGCARHQVTGTYTAYSANAAVMLQLTEGHSRTLMGDLKIVSVTPAGGLRQGVIDVTGGAVDPSGHGFVLTLRDTAAGLLPRNVTGRLTGSGLELDVLGGVHHLARGTPEAFDSDIRLLETLAQDRRTAIAKQKQAAEDARTVAALTGQLTAYSQRIQSLKVTPSIVRTRELALVEAARKQLALERALQARHQGNAAGQAAYRIGELEYQMGQIKYQVDNVVAGGRHHLAMLDHELAASPCVTRPGSPQCADLQQAKTQYEATRLVVLGDIGRLVSDIDTNTAAIDRINYVAGH